MEEIVIGVYRAKESGNITIFPMFKKEFGAYTSINLPITLIHPNEMGDLGDAVIKCIDIVINTSYSENDIGTPVIDTKKRKDMTRLYQYQSIFYEFDEGFTFNPTVGERDGSFSFMGIDMGIKVSSTVSKTEIGEEIIKTFNICR